MRYYHVQAIAKFKFGSLWLSYTYNCVFPIQGTHGITEDALRVSFVEALPETTRVCFDSWQSFDYVEVDVDFDTDE